jgi:hypothetical protein
MRLSATIALSMFGLLGSATWASADCISDSKKYSVGSVLRQADHFLYRCTPGDWQILNLSAQIAILSATWGSDVNACEVTGAVTGKCNGQDNCSLTAIEGGPFQCNVHSNLRLIVGYTCRANNKDIPGSSKVVAINQGNSSVLSCPQ